jgi:hypothetical protein
MSEVHEPHRELHLLASQFGALALRWHLLRTKIISQPVSVQEVAEFDRTLDEIRNQIRHLMDSVNEIGSSGMTN